VILLVRLIICIEISQSHLSFSSATEQKSNECLFLHTKIFNQVFRKQNTGPCESFLNVILSSAFELAIKDLQTVQVLLCQIQSIASYRCFTATEGPQVLRTVLNRIYNSL
jgi:hypothetical protein